jgi:hypothetical protein
MDIQLSSKLCGAVLIEELIVPYLLEKSPFLLDRVPCRVQYIQPVVSNLNQVNPVHALPPCSFKCLWTVSSIYA